ncbi:hypothetical protein [Bacillus piscicola]|uniref:hypothetical protein n=1 Tax=Bacillus piscicola TaxID=1632684 RepID=UPI001F09E3B3|nr:hypothetical protein [Bacillus piscicola]
MPKQESRRDLHPKDFTVQPCLSFDDVKDQLIYHYLYIQSAKSDEKGTILVSAHSLSKEVGWGYRIVRGIIKRLENQGYINVDSAKKGHGIRITINDFYTFEDTVDQESEGNVKMIVKGNVNDNDSEKHWESKAPEYQGRRYVKEKVKEDVNEVCIKPDSMDTETSEEITPGDSGEEMNLYQKPLTYKDVAAICKKKLPAVRSSTDSETFVEIIQNIDQVSEINKRLLVRYIEVIRMTRATCKVTTNILIRLAERFSKYPLDVVHYALYKHVLDHEDKREEYTAGILRNTNVHEARRRLMKIKNRRREEIHNEGIDHEDVGSVNHQYDYGF